MNSKVPRKSFAYNLVCAEYLNDFTEKRLITVCFDLTGI